MTWVLDEVQTWMSEKNELLGVKVFGRKDNKKRELLIKGSMDGAEFFEKWTRWRAGDLIQTAFSNLSDPQREWLMTGLEDKEFKALFPRK